MIPHVETVEEIEEVKKLIGIRPIKVLAKIQNCIALRNLSAIIEKADGLIIERWMLSQDFPPAHLVFVQDFIINKCKLLAKPVILASRIIESMSKKPLPSPSDVADIALAITQGVDAFSLNKEIAKCENFLDCLKALCKICISTENNTDPFQDYYALEE